MNKIGFRIYRFKDGPLKGLTVNDGDWTKKVVDIRDILKLYNTEDETKFAMFLSFSEYGAYITIARSISGRGGDNAAAWIYIPNCIEVSGAELLPIIKAVKEELSTPKVNRERLTSLFSNEYREIEVAAYMPSSPEMRFAKRNTLLNPLADIIGKKIYQPIYSNYHSILIENQDGMEIIDKSVVDISTQPLNETLVLCPPFSQDIPNGVTVHFRSPEYPQFRHPIRKNLGEIVDLIFHRPGFVGIPFSTRVEENNQICGVPRFEWKKPVSRDSFRIVAAHDQNIDLTNDASINVNGEKLRWNQPMTITESKATQAFVNISVNGYEPYERVINLLNKIPTIKLHRAERAQNWAIELINGETAEMVLRSKYLSEDTYESPIEGYSPENGILKYSNSGVFKQRVIGFLIAVATFLVVCICVAAYDYLDNHNFTWQLDWPPLKIEKIGAYNDYTGAYEKPSDVKSETIEDRSGQNSSESEMSLSKAIAYLDNATGIWHRDSLKKYGLENLFDKLNTYDVDSVLQRFTDLDESTQFNKISNAFKL